MMMMRMMMMMMMLLMMMMRIMMMLLMMMMILILMMMMMMMMNYGLYIYIYMWIQDHFLSGMHPQVTSCLTHFKPINMWLFSSVGNPILFSKPLDFLWPDPSCRANREDHRDQHPAKPAHGGRSPKSGRCFEPCLCKTHGISMAYTHIYTPIHI